MGKKSRLKRERRLSQQSGEQKRRQNDISSNSNIEKIYLFIIKWGVYFILFVPLIVRKEFIFPYVFPKSTVFQVIVEIIFAFWILLALRNPKFRPHFNTLGMALALFIVVNILASFAGVDFLRSFWSTQERMTGIFSLLHLFALFTILITVFKTWLSWKRLFDIAIIAAVLGSLYALAQKLGLSFVIASPTTQRLTGTIGNPSFLASWLLFGAFFSLWGMIRERWLWRLVFYIPSFILISTILVFTGSRGPFLAFGLGLFLFAVALAIFSQNKIIKRIAIAGLLVVIIIGSSLFLMKNTSLVKNNFYLNRYTSVSFANPDLSIQSRYLVWDMAFKGWKEKPLLGWGPENFNVPFNKYLEPQLATTGTIWYDRVHNIVLDTINTTGIIGLLSYLFIFVTAIWLLIRGVKQRWKGREAKLIFAIPIIILVCYFIQNFFVFDMVNSYIMFFLLLGFISFLITKLTQNLATQNSPQQTSKVHSSQHKRRYEPAHWGRILMVMVLMIIFIYITNIRPAQASFYGIKGSFALLRRNFTQAIEPIKKALGYHNFTEGEVAKEFTKIIEQKTGDPDFAPYKEETLNFTIKEVERIYKKHPYDVTFPIMLGELYNIGSEFDPSFLRKGEEVLLKAIELSPERQSTYWIAGQNKLLLGKFKEGIGLFQQALYLNPVEAEKAKAFWYLGVALSTAGRHQEALDKLLLAQKLGYNWKTTRALRFFGETYLKVGNPKKAIEYYERAALSEPKDVAVKNRLKEIKKLIENQTKPQATTTDDQLSPDS